MTGCSNRIALAKSMALLGVSALLLLLFLKDCVGLVWFQRQHDALVRKKVQNANPHNIKPALLALSHANGYNPTWRYSLVATLVFTFWLTVFGAVGVATLSLRDGFLVMALFWVCTDCLLRYRLAHVEGAAWRGVEALVAVPGSLSCFWAECGEQTVSEMHTLARAVDDAASKADSVPLVLPSPASAKGGAASS